MSQCRQRRQYMLWWTATVGSGNVVCRAVSDGVSGGGAVERPSVERDGIGGGGLSVLVFQPLYDFTCLSLH